MKHESAQFSEKQERTVTKMDRIPELFGSLVFNDETMKERLPKDTYKAMKKTIEEGKSLDLSVANVVANAMKDWAISKGVTHFTHWFQPMTGVCLLYTSRCV